MTEAERVRSVIVLLNADPQPQNHREFNRIKKVFKNLVNTGFLKMLADSGELPSTEKKQPTASSCSSIKQQWLSKQALDCARLMNYCRHLGDYYLHLEDDIITTKGFLSAVERRLQQHLSRQTSWMILSFYNSYSLKDNTQLTEYQLSREYFGFIGQLIRCDDLPRIADYIRDNHDQQPIDALVNQYVLETGGKVYVHSPSFFQHIGIISSFEGRIQLWSSIDFPERCWTRMKRYSKHLRDVVTLHPNALFAFLKYKMSLWYARHK